MRHWASTKASKRPRRRAGPRPRQLEGRQPEVRQPGLRDCPRLFLGYKQLTSHQREVLAIVKDGVGVPAAAAGDLVDVVLDQTSFYGDSGGQGRYGAGSLRGWEHDRRRDYGCVLPVQGVRAHKALLKQPLAVGDHVNTVVDGERGATRSGATTPGRTCCTRRCARCWARM
jgi:alanyl-tRNA synthetase